MTKKNEPPIETTMKTIKHIIISIILMHLWTDICYTQTITHNEIVRSALDEMFEDLDKSKVPTGFLLDYAVDLVEFERYNGMELNDSNYVTTPVFEEILLSLKSASVSTQPYDDVSYIMTDFTTSATDNNINVAYVGYKYNFIKENALSDNLISYSANKVSDVYVNGVWQNPYGEAYVFGFTPNISVCNTGTVSFKFSETFAFYNISRALLKFDAGDGSGYRGLSPTSTITVNYTTPGRKELKFYIKTTDGVVLETHSSIYVIDSSYNNSKYEQMADIDDRIVDTTIIPATETYTGKMVRAQISTYLRKGHSALTRPFIVVEGFDPWRLTSSFDIFLKKYELGSTYHKRFMEYSVPDDFSKDYDFIYIDWYDSTEDIRDNAHLLVEIIRRINQRKLSDGCTERSIIMGQSMGGLVTRLALCMMEQNGESHEISTYISHDSPHLGANAPLGALYFLHHVMSYISGYQNAVDLVDLFLIRDLDDAKRILWEVIHSPAAKQMLVNHIDTDGTLDNSVHSNWQTTLNGVGFPQGDIGHPIECLAIVNGAPNDQYDIYNEIGQHYLYLNGYAKTSVLTDICAPFVFASGLNIFIDILGAPHLAEAVSYWGSTKFDVHAEINPFISYNSLISDLSVTYTKKFLWCIKKTFNIFSEKAYSPVSGLRYDSFGGSKYEVADTLEMQYPRADTWLYQYDFEYGLTDRIMFIPSASALGIFNATESDYLENYYLNPPIPETECPFHAYSLTDTIQRHIYLNSQIFLWLENQLSAHITGDEDAKTGSRYILSGYDGTVSWSTSNSAIATIDNSGRLTTHGNGIVSVIAESYNNGQLFRKKKEILVGFPDIVIKTSYATGDGYVFTAESTSANATQLLAQMVSAGNFQYEWSLLDSNGDRTTHTSSSNSFEYLPKDNEAITVAVRLVSAAGNKGPVKSVSANLRVPFTTNYEYVIVTGDGTAYFIKSNGTYEIGVPSQDFTVTYNYTTYDQNDNTLTINKLVEKYLKGTDCFIAYPRNAWSDNYLTGTKAAYQQKWTFTLFDMAMFLDPLESAIEDAGGTERVMYEFDLDICNSLKEKMQKIPFVIIYKPTFPEN